MLKMLIFCSVLGCLSGDQRSSFSMDAGSVDSLIVVAFGNSITATRKTVTQVFAQRLPGLLAKQGIPARVINSGIPGSHTGRVSDHSLFKIEHGLDRFDSAVLAHHPDLTIIGFGTNDAHIDSDKADGSSRIPLAQYRRNLVYMIKQLSQVGSKVILIAPSPLGGGYPEFQNVRLEKYVQTVRELSVKYKTGLCDNYQLFKNFEEQENGKVDDLLLDGVHPNDKGHQLIAGELVKEIQEIKW